jgi:hypothetical protein
MSLHIFTPRVKRDPWMRPLGSNVREAESGRSVTYVLFHWPETISGNLAL